MSTITDAGALTQDAPVAGTGWRPGRRPVMQAALFLVLLGGVIVTLFPLTWMLVTAFTPNELVFRGGTSLIPPDVTTDNFASAFRIQPVGAWIFNSVVTSVAIGGGKMLLAIPAAFAFAHFEFRGRNFLFMLVVVTMTIPYVITLIPTYLGIVQIGWYNSYLGAIVPSAAFCGFATFFLRQAFMILPRELFEAAGIDGATPFQMLVMIALPNSKSAVASLAVLSFLSAWNLYLWPQIVLDDPEMKTLAIGLKLFATSQEQLQQWGPLMATALIGLLPAIFIFVFAQRYLIDGFVNSGIK